MGDTFEIVINWTTGETSVVECVPALALVRRTHEIPADVLRALAALAQKVDS